MGRRKLEMKRIEDKSSRLVTFSKRRAGLVSKARHLSVLCDADVAAIVFSARGKLYEFSSGTTTNSVEHILSRYQNSCLVAEEITTKGVGDNVEPFLECKRFQTCKVLLNAVDRLAGHNNVEELSVNDMTELEQELDTALTQTRLRKTQMMMDYISSLQQMLPRDISIDDSVTSSLIGAVASAAILNRTRVSLAKYDNKLTEEKQELEKQVAALSEAKENGDGGDGDLNNLATNQIKLPQLITLPLFRR